MNDTEALLALNAVKGLGNAGIGKLLERFGTAANVLARPNDLLKTPLVLPRKVLWAIKAFPVEGFLRKEIQQMRKRQVHAVSLYDEEYPESLREIPDAPAVLYVKGQLLKNSSCLAIVGSRRASYYGISTAEKFAGELTDAGFDIVSGLARGIDTAAHRGTLKAGGRTVAVLGCGLDHIYPPENRELFDQISQDGAIISEFPMATMPMPYNFPRRNRIISGLSQGVVVIEAAKRSGALITADFALEQGRDVYAVPGKIDQAASAGVNGLIQQGAKLVTCTGDIIEDLRPLHQNHGPTELFSENQISSNRIKELTGDEQVIFEYITDRPVHIDEITERCDLSTPVMSVLLKLELKQLIRQLPGKLFVR